MLVQALYNIVDSIFVSQLCEEAMTAVTLVFPMQNLMVSLAMGTGVGVNAILSKALGEKKYEDANSAANTGLLLNFIHFIIFFFVGLFLSKAFVMSQNDDPVIVGYGIDYMKVISVLSFGCFFQIMLERLLQSTGRTSLSMISQTAGAVINMILDPIMIFGLFGFPRLEVAGAALATCIGQMCASFIGLTLNIKANRDITLSISRIIKPRADIVGRIYFVGIPSTLMMAIGSVMTYFMNKITGKFSSTAQTVFGIYFKLQSFFFMPVFGLNNGLIPVLAYNYGLGDKKRIKEALRFSVCVAVSIMLAGTVLFELIPQVFLQMFKPSEDLLRLGIPALRIIGLHYPLAAVAIVLGSVFQAFSKSYFSLFVSLGRQLVILIPVAWLLSMTGSVTNVWWSFPISEVVSLMLTVIFFTVVKRTVIDRL
ncbi:MAG: MATE family efflux transporter [Clostridiales bacterium]|nr:MATE family efflux transporter [Clostridiales bacterium]